MKQDDSKFIRNSQGQARNEAQILRVTCSSESQEEDQ